MRRRRPLAVVASGELIDGEAVRSSAALLPTWTLLILRTLGVHSRKVAGTRREHLAVYCAIGEPPLVA